MAQWTRCWANGVDLLHKWDSDWSRLQVLAAKLGVWLTDGFLGKPSDFWVS